MEKFLKKVLDIYPIRSYLRSATKGEQMINDQEIKEWVERCPEHDNEILHSDENGIVICIRFNNEKEDPDEA